MRDMYWLITPSVLVFYALPLVLILTITIVRAGALAWLLFGDGARDRMPLDRVLDGSVSADDLARAALGSRAFSEALPDERIAKLRKGPPIERDAVLRTLRAADARFDYLWRGMASRVSSTWSLMRLTILSAAFIATYGFAPTWQSLTFGDRISTTAIAGLPQYEVEALFETAEWTLKRLAFGLAIAGLLCVIAMVFDGLIQRRLTSWKYFYATTRDALSDGQGLPVE